MKKDYNNLSYLCFRSLFMGIGLSKILISTKSYFFISIILGTLFGLLLMYLYRNITNKYISIISNYILLFVLFIILINLISTVYLTNMSRLLIGLPILLLLIYQSTKDTNNIYRVSNILLIFNILLYVIALTSLISYVDISNIKFDKLNINNILTNSITYTMISITPYIITKDKLNIEYKPYKSYIISSITMSIIFFITLSILGNNLISIYRYPEYIILKNVSITNAIENIENIVCFMWIFDIYALMINITDKLKNNINNKYILYLVLISNLLLTTITGTYYQIIISIYKYLSIILGILLLLNIFVKEKSR